MVVSIILSILKIIGIILLCILGLILLIALLVLFVPIRYKVTADSNINEIDKEYHVTAKVSWFLCLVRGKYEYPSEDWFIVKAGPFTIYGGKEKPEKEGKPQKAKKFKMKGSSDSRQTENSQESVNQTMDTGLEAEKKDVGEQEKSNADDVKLLEETLDGENEKKSNRKTLKEKILYTRQKIYDKINKILTKIKNIIANIKKYITILQSEEFKNAFALCKDSVVRLFCMIKPRKIKLNGTIGLKSPDQTGYACAVIGVVSPYFKNQIQVNPDFENYIIQGNALIKGRIYIFVLLMIAIKAFFDKNIRKVIEMFHREES